MRILLTGASGMVGANLAHHCLALNHTVMALIRSPEIPVRLRPISADVHLLRADLRDEKAVVTVLSKARPEVVVHMAGTPFNPPPSIKEHIDTNVIGTTNLMAALGQLEVQRVIFTGTAAQYGSGDNLTESDPDQPNTLLGITKQCAAEIVHGYGRLLGIETVEIRLFTPYGPWERPGRLVPHTILSALRGHAVTLGNGRQERDWTYIGDVVTALARALKASLPSGTKINICSGQGISVADVAGRILSLFETAVPLHLGALPTRSDEIWKLSGNNTKAKALLGWSPTVGLEDGLRSTIEWFTTHPYEVEQLV